MEFRWNAWNLEHATQHGVSEDEAERVVEAARPPFPRRIADDKWLVWGRGVGGRFVQVIYVIDEDATFYVIHARPMNEKEKSQYRRLLR